MAEAGGRAGGGEARVCRRSPWEGGRPWRVQAGSEWEAGKKSMLSSRGRPRQRLLRVFSV